MPYSKIRVKSTNPFDDGYEDDDYDVDDETFLRGGSYAQPPAAQNGNHQLQSILEQKRAIQERTLGSTQRSLGVLRESEQIGVATAEELSRQREKLERTETNVLAINAQLRQSQKHLNSIKSVFSSLKNYMSGGGGGGVVVGNTAASTKTTNSNKNSQQPELPTSTDTRTSSAYLAGVDRYDMHPSTRLKRPQLFNDSFNGATEDFNSRLDANLEEMSSNIVRLKGLANGMSQELSSQNDLIENIIGHTDKADLSLARQQKDMTRILKK